MKWEKYLLSDHKIISEEESICEAEKRLKVKQRKSPLSYHDFVYGETQFEEPPKVSLKGKDVNLQKHLEQAQLRNYDPKLWKSLPIKYFCYVKQAMLKFEKQTGLVKEMKDDFKYVTSLEDEFDEKYELSKQGADVKDEMKKRCAQYEKDFAKLEAHCISLELKSQNQSLTSLQNGQVLKEPSDVVTIKIDLDELDTKNIELEHITKSSNVTQNEVEDLQSQLSEFGDKKFDKVFQKIESMKKKMFDSRITSDFFQKSLYDSEASNGQTKSGEKKILFRNETKIKELEMILAQQTKDFEDAKVDFSKTTDKYETYFEKLKNTRVVLEQQLDRKIQDSKAEKDQFL
ncbi:hypothetical protein Tco_1476543 [Tanacetum coccineum]